MLKIHIQLQHLNVKMKLANKLYIDVIPDGNTMAYDMYKKQVFDLACKGYKTITENGISYIDLDSINADDIPGVMIVGPHTGMLYDTF